MNNLDILVTALEYVENNLHEDIRTEDIAKACFCSKATLEKLFRHINHISVRDYLIRRRMMVAGKMLVYSPENNVLDIALRCGYGTSESFGRAFQKIWNCSPSEFRKKGQMMELFPKMFMYEEFGDEYMKERRNFDISELYDLFASRKNCYFVCCDIRSLVPINEISMAAGDLAILETMQRMEKAAGQEDLVFRIGGDEFVMLTASEELTYAEGIVAEILKENGKPIVFEGREIPLSLYGTAVKVDLPYLKYDALFTELHKAARDCKDYE